jgi:hypothetical protein
MNFPIYEKNVFLFYQCRSPLKRPEASGLARGNAMLFPPIKDLSSSKKASQVEK